MKKILIYLGFLFSVLANATTLPVQLLNPASSTAGQAVVSTGASSAVAWGTPTISAGNIAPIAASTMLANPTGSSAAPQATTATSFFDNAYCNTIGYVIVRFTGAWTCAKGVPANPVWWGADPSGASSSTAALNNAVAAAVYVQFQPGTYLFSTAPATISAGGAIVSGAGAATVLQVGYATGDFLHLTGQYSNVNNLYISNTTTHTSGADIDADAASVTLDNLTTVGAYIGTLFTPNCNLCTGTNLVHANMTAQATASGSAGIVVGSTTGLALPNQVMLTNITVQGLSSALPSYAMEVLSATGLQVTSFELEQAAAASLAFVPPTGNGVNYSFLTNGFLDRGQNGFLGRPGGGTGEIFGAWFTNVWFGDNLSASSVGIDLDNGGSGTNQGFYCTNCHVVNASGTTSYGMIVNSNSWSNISVSNSCFAGNTTAGVLEAAGVTHQTWIGTTFGNCDGWGTNGSEDFAFTAGASDYIQMQGNTFNSSAKLVGVSGITGTHSMIQGNIGYNPLGVTSTTPTSGTSYSNGPTPETCYLSASTSISSVFIPASGGTNIISSGAITAGTPVTFDLGPNETFNASFSGTGHLVCSVH